MNKIKNKKKNQNKTEQIAKEQNEITETINSFRSALTIQSYEI